MRYASSWARAVAGVDEAWQQRQERMNRTLKGMREKLIRRSPVDLLREVRDLVILQQNNERSAIYGDGPYDIAESSRKYGMSKSAWEALSEKDQVEHVRLFRKSSFEMKPNPFRPKKDRMGRKRNARLGRKKNVSFRPQPEIKFF